MSDGLDTKIVSHPGRVHFQCFKDHLLEAEILMRPDQSIEIGLQIVTAGIEAVLKQADAEVEACRAAVEASQDIDRRMQ